MNTDASEPVRIIDEDGDEVPGFAEAAAGVWWDISCANVANADEAEQLVRELLERWTLPGDNGQPVIGALST